MAATYDGSQVVLYLDGAQVAAVGASGGIGGTSENLFLGRRSDGYNLGGQLDDVRIYDRALSAAEVAVLLAPPVADTIAPSVPTGLTADGSTGTGVALEWQPSTDNVGVTGYRVYRDSTVVGTTPGDTTFTDTTVSPETTYSYEVAALDATGNVSGRSTPVPVTTPTPNAAPTAVATATPTSGDAPLAVVFGGSGSSDPDGQVTAYAWTFGDGATSTQADPSHSYTQPGGYTATLTVTDDDGAQNSDSVAIQVNHVDTAPLYGLLGQVPHSFRGTR